MTSAPSTPATSGALAEPVVPVRGRWIAMLVLANLAVFMGFFTPIQQLLPEQIKAIDPDHKEAMLAWVTGIGAFAAVVVNPLAGALSDRTTASTGRRWRWLGGRRHPWTLGGALLGGAALVFLSGQRSIVGVAIGWVLAQTFLNTMLASLTAAVPDRVPVAQRGAVSGWVGIPQVLGLVLGVALVTLLVTGVAAGYVAIAVAVVVLALPFPLLTPDDPLPPEEKPAFSLRRFWVSPREYPDFAWTFGTRFLVFLGNALGTLYLLYFLTDQVHYHDPDTGLLVLILIYTVALIATTVLSGRRSDRTGRRRVFVVVAGVVMAVAALLLAVAPTWPVAMVAAGIMGGGYGIYLAVDNALVTQVLPAVRDRAKDLGVVNIASSAPQVLAPVIAAPVVRSLGGYPVLYLLTAVVTLLGSVFVYRIRSVA
ncbi:MAG TPA: MFS transporter [Rugosimonospora sp.]|nr:MFS transporter [Rugosimonospora sp.]